MAASIEGDTSEVRIELASIAEQRLLANLLQLYVHDLSEIFTGVQLGADGLFGYPRLASYWSEPQTHFPFLIRSFGKVAGFALAQRGSPMSDDPSVSSSCCAASGARVWGHARRCCYGTHFRGVGSCASRKRTVLGCRSGPTSFGDTRVTQ